MDLLEIRKKAKEKKAAEEAAKQGAAPPGEGAVTDETVPQTAEPEEAAVAQAEAPAGRPAPAKPAVRRKRKAAPKPSSQTKAAPESVQEPPAAPDIVKPGPPPPPSPSQPAPRVELEDELSGYLSEEGPAEEDIVEYLAFMLGREEYAVRVDDVREIIRLQKVTTVPRAPEFVRGIISLRGVIIPVLDIKKRLGLDQTADSRSTRIIVVSDDGSPHGIIVDKVTGVARLKADGIEPTPAVIGGVEAEYLEGVGRIGERLLILFNTERVSAMEGRET